MSTPLVRPSRCWPAVLGAAVLALLVVLLASPALAQQAGPWRVTDYEVSIVIGDDSTLDVTETIEVDFEGDQRGIFRYWEVTERLPNPLPPESTIEIEGDPADYQRRTEVSDVAVTSETGAPTDVQLTESDGELTARIGDPDTYVTGVQRYELSYRVSGAMNSFADHDELYWDPIGSWPVDVADLAVVVQAPGIQQVACYAGTAGTSDPTCPTDVEADRATFDFGAVSAGVYPTIVVGLAPGAVDVATPMVERIPTPADELRDTLFGNVWAVVLAALVAVGGIWLAASRAWRVGRDRVAVGGVTASNRIEPGHEGQRRGLFESPVVPVQFRPPNDLRPGLLGVLIDEKVDPVDVSATIVDLATRGYITITELEDGGWFSRDDWELTRVPGQDTSALSAWELEVLDGLFEDRVEVRVSDLKGKFSGTYEAVSTMLYDEMERQRWFTRDPESARNAWRGAGLAIAVLGFIGIFVLGPRGWGLLAGALVLVGIVVLALSGRAPARTPKGSRLLTETLGFREFIERAEADRMDFAEKERIFVDYLPYAVVFGVVDQWAKAFADIGIDLAAATSGFYVGYGTFDAMRFSSGMNSFAATASTAVSTAPPSSSGGGSGFGGGGFSGGGGGGGGGGAW